MPLHRHEVSLDFTRIELQVEYTFLDDWDVWLRIPYEIKHRDASVDFVKPVTPAERDAILRNARTHHRSKTLEGFSDFKLLVARRLTGLVVAGDTLDLASGTSLPVGETERDPFEAGDEGEAHEHIQFGTGTFDPLVEITYSFSPADDLFMSVYTQGRFPFYENRHGYLGPPEVAAGTTGRYWVLPWMALQSDLVFFYQDFAHWDGDRDENSGWYSFGAGGGLVFRPRDGMNVSFTARFPIVQETLSDEGDAFEQGALFLVNAAYAF